MQTSLELRIQLHGVPFQPAEQLEQWQQHLERLDACSAAESLFIGRVRPSTGVGIPLTALELEHYPGMTEQQLQQLASSCANRHGTRSVLVLHRMRRPPSGGGGAGAAPGGAGAAR